MIAELDSVALTRDLPDHSLGRDHVGTVVHRYERGDAFEVEFVTGRGDTVAVLTLERAALRPFDGHEILHLRPLAASV